MKRSFSAMVALAGRKHHASVECAPPLKVQRQPDNKFDPNAFAVLNAYDQLVGYVPRHVASALSHANAAVTDVELLADDQLRVAVEVPPEADVDSLTAIMGIVDARVANLRLCLRSVLERSPNDWFDAALLERTLGSEENAAVQLWVRLSQRKEPDRWFYLKDDDEAAAELLATNELVETFAGVEPTSIALYESLVGYVNVAALKDVAAVLGLPKTKWRREAVLDHLRNTRTLTGESLAESAAVRANVNAVVPGWVRLNPTLLALVRRAKLLFSLDPSGDAYAQLTRGAYLGNLRFYPYTCDNVMPFVSLADLRHYEAAQLLYEKLQRLAPSFLDAADAFLQASLSEDLDRAIDECVVPAFQFLSGIKDVDDGRDVGRMSAEWRYVSICHYGSKILERLKRHEEATHVLRVLLRLPFTRKTRRRGYWWERLALDLEKHLKRELDALDACRSGLEDAAVRTGARLALLQRGARLASKCHMPWDEQKVPPRSAASATQTKTVVVVGRPLNKAVGEKSRFVSFGADGDSVSVEALCLEWYAMEEHGAWEGAHVENAFLNHLFGVLFFDILFVDGVQGVFLTPYQNAPLDLDTDEFYPAREQLIVARLDEVRRVGVTGPIVRAYEAYNGYACRGVHWEDWPLEACTQLANCIGSQVVAAMCAELAQDHAHWRGGLPDLLLWNVQARAAKFVEVKGPRDRLSDQQRAWIACLQKCGADVEICHVKEPDLSAEEE